MHNHAPRRSAALTCSSDRAEENRLRRHFQVSSWANDQRVVAPEFHDCLPQPAMDGFRDVQSHRDRASSGNQWNSRVVGKFLTDRFAVTNQQTEDCRIGTRFATNAFGNLCDRNRSQRSFFRRFPNGRVATNCSEGGIPGPDRHRKIKRGDYGDESERMPLLHQTMVFSLRLNRQAVKHARLADGEIADVDHLLNFAFTFGNDLAGLESDELTKLMFQLAERISETANSIATDRAGRSSPFFERFLRTRDRGLVILVGGGANTCQPPAIDRRDLVDLRATAAAGPITGENTGVFLSNPKLFQRRCHRWIGRSANASAARTDVKQMRLRRLKLASRHSLLDPPFEFIFVSGNIAESNPSLRPQLPR